MLLARVRTLFTSLISVGFAALHTFLVVAVSAMPDWKELFDVSSHQYLGASCVAFLIAFAVLSPHRRMALALTILATWIASRLSQQIQIKIDLMVVWFCANVLITVAVEIVRQNIATVLEVRRTDSGYLRKLASALLYWSPMIVFVAIGGQLHSLLVGVAEKVVFDTTPIDRYCTATGGALPCDEVFNANTEPTHRPLSQNIEIYWEERFRAWQKHVIAEVGSLGDEKFNLENRPSLNTVLKKYLATPDVLGLRLVDDRIEEEVLLGSDPVTQRLRATRAELQRPHEPVQQALPNPNIGGWLQYVNVNEIIAYLRKEELARVEEQLKAQTALVLGGKHPPIITNQEASESAVIQLKKQMAGAVSTVALPGIEPGLAPPAAARARAIAKLLIYSEQVRRQTLGVALAVANHVPRAEGQYSAIGIPSMCSFEAKSREVVSQEVDGEPAAINVGSFPCESRLVAGRHGQVIPQPMRTSIELSIDKWEARKLDDLEHSTVTALLNADKGEQIAGEQAQALEASRFRRIALGRKPCCAFFGQVQNAAAEFLEERYESTRRSAGQAFVDGADASRKAVGTLSDQAIFALRNQGSREIRHAAADLRKALGLAESTAWAVDTVLLVLVCLLLAKSLLYTMSLKVFALKTPSSVRVRLDSSAGAVGEGPKIAGSAASSTVLRFDDVTSTTPLVTREFLDGQVQYAARLPPWPFSSLIARLLHFRYYGFNVGGPMSDAIVRWNAGEGRYIVDWRLAPGEKVVFSYRYFIGASRHIRLYSHISFRLDTMLFGRFIFAVAEAPPDRPAHLLLALESLNPTEDVCRTGSTVMVERLAAWNAGIRFQATITPHLSSVYLDPFSLVRVPQAFPGAMLIDTRPVRAGFFGIFRYALRALSPF